MQNLTNHIASSYEENTNPIIYGKNSLITALFKNPKVAENIYEELLSQGYEQEDITVVMSEETHKNCFLNYNSHLTPSDIGNKTLEGLGLGATIGGSLGAAAAAIAAAGTTLAIPGLGLIVAGSLAAGFAGAGAGAAAGGLIGALIGSDTPNDQIKLLEEGLKDGGIVIAVKASSDDERSKIHQKWLALQKQETI